MLFPTTRSIFGFEFSPDHRIGICERGGGVLVAAGHFDRGPEFSYASGIFRYPENRRRDWRGLSTRSGCRHAERTDVQLLLVAAGAGGTLRLHLSQGFRWLIPGTGVDDVVVVVAIVVAD